MTGDRQQPISGPKKLRQLLSDPSKTIVAPGVYDGITARLAIESGAECLYMVGPDLTLYVHTMVTTR
jgi:2-methylisocitrate lyase-like PEP mutase family enzyme